jgi:hypothetical protein
LHFQFLNAIITKSRWYFSCRAPDSLSHGCMINTCFPHWGGNKHAPLCACSHSRGGSSAFNSYIIRDTPPPTTTKKKKQFTRSRQREETAIIITLSEFVSRLQMCIPSRPGSHTKRCVSHSHTKSAISPRVQTLCWCERVTCL